jgi:RHS repeat-associated protein
MAKQAQAQSSSGEQGAISSPVISLPKGGGAIRGMGEKFAANPATGSGFLSAPIYTSLGRAGFGPQLSISYDSNAGNGAFGFGWSLSLPSITRKTEKGLPKYLDSVESDIFILSGAEDLVPHLEENGGQWTRRESRRVIGGQTYVIRAYRPRIEGLFARIERWTNQSDPADTFWRSISRENITTWYGKTEESRIFDPEDPARIFSWLICESHDDKGNLIVYQYKLENSDGVVISQAHERNRTSASRSANRYLKRIRYGNSAPYYPVPAEGRQPPQPETKWLFEAVFDYGEHDPDHPLPEDTGQWPARPDPFSSYRAGFEVRTYRLCQRVLMFHNFIELGATPCLVRSTDFTYSYENDPESSRNPIFSFLVSATQSGYKRRADGSYLRRAMPPLEFQYSQPVIQEAVLEMDADSLENLPYGLDGGHYQWVDLDGEGLSGILTEQGQGWFYKRNLGAVKDGESAIARLGPAELVASRPSLSAVESGRAQLLDLAGDGRLDLADLEAPTPGFYERTQDDGWESFVPFESLPNVDWSNPHLKFIDLTGDGHADILISEDEAFSWSPSLSEAGFGPLEKVWKVLDEEKGPNLVFADLTQSIHLADMSGDGLTDLVRIRNGEVCYWPNLGYGRFGPKVTMDNAPWLDAPDQFDQRRIRLVDIDGSGVTDIIYLAGDGVRIYFNQSGNSWGDLQRLAAFPTIDNLSSVQAVDLLGNGVACLVWSSPLPGDARRPMRYVDLMGGQKPHLLVKSANNLGAETIVHYAPSTRFYLADKLAGRPWITRLPFPVHVVERVETHDRISGARFVTRYDYHHGYFDGVEREFRGFGMVEQLDTEEFAALDADQQSPAGTNYDRSSHVPPVLTRTWFHTGVYLDRNRISNFFAGLLNDGDAGEYYREPGLSDEEARRLLLDDTVAPDGLPSKEEREACRALKGAMLRQEVYGLDGTESARHPYTVTEQNLTIRRLQPMAANRHAVFFTHPREAVIYHYERRPGDPRVAHTLTLEAGEFGNILRSAAIAYGRRNPDATLPPQDQIDQTRTHITCTENDYTNPVELDDDYRTPLPSESRAYELTGLSAPVAGGRFSFGDLLDGAASAASLAYERKPDPDLLQKRLIEQARTLYRPNDLGSAQGDPLALLPLGEVESRALPGESYKLAFTAGLISEVYGSKGADLVFETEGRYIHGEGDEGWWIPSGRVFFSPGTADGAAAELAYAREHFFLPHRFRDPFHTTQVETESFVSYDDYDLLVRETRDAAGNLGAAGEQDYRVLQPASIIDPNRNRTAVAFDALGIVVGAAVMGKAGENLGDSMEGFEADLSDAVIAASLKAPLANPHAILQRASQRFVYDLFAYYRTRESARPDPALAYTLAREIHDADLAPGKLTRIQHVFSYSDGFGREIQKKIQAEPGPLVDGGPETNPRWVGSGWTVFNNKGNPVRQFEPFFTTTHRFEFDVRRGVSPIIFYDPAQRAVATLHPNHTWQKVVFDAWSQETWDVNDTVLIADPRTDLEAGDYFSRLPEPDYLPTWYAQRESGSMGTQERAAAIKAAAHDSTPSVTHLDSLGRAFLTIAHNRFKRGDADAPTDEVYRTRIVFDIEGNQREVIDAKGRAVMRYDYDLLGNQIHSFSMDAGERWMLNDVAGKPIRAWDGRGHQFRTEYDPLRRPLRWFVRGFDPDQSDPHVFGREALFEQIEYGEGQSNDLGLNLRARIFKSYDGAGVFTSEVYDFKGNLLRGSRQLAVDYKSAPDWSGAVVLDGEIFTSATAYDALNRPISLVTPGDSEIRPAYNEASLLERVEARIRGEAEWITLVSDIDYNARGQREMIAYGNGASTAYRYDPLTFRLRRLRTTRSVDGALLQDMAYTYDPAGNITEIEDRAQPTIFFANVEVTPSAQYEYDAIYQLIRADGREHAGQTSQRDQADPPYFNIPHVNDTRAMRRYTERYEYDSTGNILKLIHHAESGAWAQYYDYAADSNRLLATSLPGDDPDGPYSARYPYNAHGSMAAMPHLPGIQWDFKEQMCEADLRGGGRAYYVYDATGQRVRKVREHNGSTVEERIYLGSFEVYRKRVGGILRLERETLHIFDSQKRIAMVETKTVDETSPVDHQYVIRYQLDNHLGSACLELDGTGRVISYEEYHPYGTTSYRATDSSVEVSLKRYRYTGKEKDEETGLYYHGARYYACWLGRWTGSDPKALIDGLNLYRYVRNSPANFTDSTGYACDDEYGCPPDNQSDIPARLMATWFYDTKHAIENTFANSPAMQVLKPADPGMKWKFDYATDAHGNQTFETVVTQVPSEGWPWDQIDATLDRITAFSGIMAASSPGTFAFSTTGTNQQTRVAKDVAETIEQSLDPPIGTTGNVWTFDFIHGSTPADITGHPFPAEVRPQVENLLQPGEYIVENRPRNRAIEQLPPEMRPQRTAADIVTAISVPPQNGAFRNNIPDIIPYVSAPNGLFSDGTPWPLTLHGEMGGFKAGARLIAQNDGQGRVIAVGATRAICSEYCCPRLTALGFQFFRDYRYAALPGVADFGLDNRAQALGVLLGAGTLRRRTISIVRVELWDGPLTLP